MIVLYVIAWIVLALFGLFILFLLMPIRYDLRGYWQEKFSGIVNVGIGPFQGLIKWAADGNNIFALRFLGITLVNKPLSKNIKKKEKKKETTPAKKDKRSIN